MNMKEICRLGDISESSFSVQLSRGTFTPEHTRHGGRGTPREFTLTDAKHLCLTARLTSLGVPPAIAEAVWREVCNPIDLYSESEKLIVLLPGNRIVTFKVEGVAVADLPPVATVVSVRKLFDWVAREVAERGLS